MPNLTVVPPRSSTGSTGSSPNPRPQPTQAQRAEQYRDDFLARFDYLRMPMAKLIAEGLPPSFSASDLAQDGFLGLMEAADTYDRTKGSPEYWAWKCIRRAIYASIRGRNWRNAVYEPIKAEPIVLPTAERNLDAQRLEAAVERAKATLDPRERVVLDLIFYGGESLESVAQKLGIRQRWLRHIKAAGLAKMRRALHDQGIRQAA